VIRVRQSWPFAAVVVGGTIISVHLSRGAARNAARRWRRMAKRDAKFPASEKTVTCIRCHAPANRSRPGGKLVPVTGFRVGTRGSERRRGGHRIRFYQHADTAYCAIRMPTAKLNVPHMLRPRR
jgi:hypothetical protein